MGDTLNVGQAIAGLVLRQSATRGIVEEVAAHLKERARDKIGHYQSATGPFEAWPALAESTEREKARLGYPTGSPLLRSGGTRDSIGYSVDGDGMGATVGATDPNMATHEFGNGRVPARPVFGPLIVEEREAMEKALLKGVVAGLGLKR
ncbi:MAG: phage virion morphogenesis protein [Burkholderiales bacterium]|nr:phage virion morphogenesis protein [Burkholderiales bacterium]